MNTEYAEPMNFLLLHGRSHKGACYDYTAEYLLENGHAVYNPDLPISGEGHTYDTQAELAASIVRGLRNVVVAAHSRAGNVGPRVINRLMAMGHEDNVLCLDYICPSIPYALSQQHLAEYEPEKYHAGYMDTILDLSNGLTLLNPLTAPNFLYNNCPPERLEAAITDLRPHNIEDENVAPLSSHPAIPTNVYIGARDRVLSPSHIAFRSWNALGVEPQVRNWDHTPQYSYPEELARELMWTGAVALKERQEVQ